MYVCMYAGRDVRQQEARCVYVCVCMYLFYVCMYVCMQDVGQQEARLGSLLLIFRIWHAVCMCMYVHVCVYVFSCLFIRIVCVCMYILYDFMCAHTYTDICNVHSHIWRCVYFVCVRVCVLCICTQAHTQADICSVNS